MSIKDAIQEYANCFSLKLLENENKIMAYCDVSKSAKLIHEKGERGIRYLSNSKDSQYSFCRSGDIFLACFDNIKIHE